jgi:4-hydroxyacetophenone monooxygenase
MSESPDETPEVGMTRAAGGDAYRAVLAEGGSGRPAGLADRAAVQVAVEAAAVPVLLMLLFQMTGDQRWLADRYRPQKFKGVAPRKSGGLSQELQAEVRAAAVDAVEALLAGQQPTVVLDTDEAMERPASFFLGQDVDGRFVSILREELGRRLYGTSAPKASRRHVPGSYRAIVIGMGISGLAAINVLQQLGIEYTVFERGPEAGGVWHQNQYPGAGVDTPSHLYSFSFHYRDWERHYELRDNLYQYFNDVLDGLGARDHVRFESEVVSAAYDEDAAMWTVSVRRADGQVEEHVANVVISGVGSLNQPRIPDLPGMGTFAGLQFHSNVWPENLDLTDKRVAVVGAGASSQQICPEIAPLVQRLSVVQRSPQWVAPFDQFRQSIDEQERLLLEHVPLYRAWNWVGLFWQHGDKIIDGLRVDPEWEHPARSVNARNDRAREFLTGYIHEQLDGRPDLIEKAVPDYPPFGKRMLLDNGWYAMLKRDNVDLVADSVAEVTETGVRLTSGEHLEVDVIIWATGFKATEFLCSLDVYGRHGQRLREVWQEDDPRAFLGVSIPDFPNLFLLGGPNSLPGSGSFMYVTELQADYIRELLDQMQRHGYAALDATDEASARYNDLVDEMHEQTIWCHGGFTTYYRNSKGRVIFIMPFLNVEYWGMLRHPDLTDYTVTEQVARAGLARPA